MLTLSHPAPSYAADINIFWHPQGDYLAVKVDRFTKTRKSTYTGFELFSIREKGIPMDVSGCGCVL
jgi:translation initiation factor 3 subunit B